MAFLKCPVCGKKPYVETYDAAFGLAFCKGHGFHRHKKVCAFIPYEQPSKLLKSLSLAWNQLQYEQARFLFHVNGNPFKEDVKDDRP